MNKYLGQPWEISHTGQIYSDGKVIARIEWIDSDAQTQANRDMFMAVPDMLDVLVYLVEKSHDSDDACMGTLATHFVRKVIEPVIAKATGE